MENLKKEYYRKTYRKTGYRYLLYLALLCLLLFPGKTVHARSKIRISNTTVKLKIGQTKKISLKGMTAKKVTWTSSNKKIATVSKGKIKARKTGKVTITAKAKGKKYRCKVTVTDNLRLSAATLKLKANQVKKINLKGIAAKKVSWGSSNQAVATVDGGVITALKGGKATITAKANGKKYSCKLTVVSINYDKVTLAPGNKVTLSVKNGLNTIWTSSNTAVAAVSKKGVVTGKKTGSATIKCVSNKKTFKVKIYVASLNKPQLRIAVNSSYQLSVNNTGDIVSFTSGTPDIATVTNEGYVTAIKPGNATIICKTGNAQLSCAATVIAPDDLTTPDSMLPASSNVDRQEVTVNGYPSYRTYTVYKQSATVNKTDGKGTVQPAYMPNHGCAACALSTVLSGFKGYKSGPAYLVETIEKKVFGETSWKANYSKAMSSQMPLSLYGVSRILSYYGIPNSYVRNFPGSQDINGKIADGDTSDVQASVQILKHLKTGNPVIIEVSATNRKTGKQDKLWSNSYHTMALLGVTSSGKVIVADAANRSTSVFGSNQRVKYVNLNDLIPYMFSSTKLTSTSLYWGGKSVGGGYILVNPQN